MWDEAYDCSVCGDLWPDESQALACHPESQPGTQWVCAGCGTVRFTLPKTHVCRPTAKPDPWPDAISADEWADMQQKHVVKMAEHARAEGAME